MQISFVLFIIGLPTVDRLLTGVGRNPHTLTLISLLTGSVAGIAMTAVDRHRWMLDQAGLTEAAELFSQNVPVFLTTRPPGLFYPIGLVALALLMKPGRIASWQRLTLVVGAVLFPVGRVAGVESANLASALLLALVWWTLVPPAGNVEAP